MRRLPDARQLRQQSGAVKRDRPARRPVTLRSHDLAVTERPLAHLSSDDLPHAARYSPDHRDTPRNPDRCIGCYLAERVLAAGQCGSLLSDGRRRVAVHLLARRESDLLVGGVELLPLGRHVAFRPVAAPRCLQLSVSRRHYFRGVVCTQKTLAARPLRGVCDVGPLAAQPEVCSAGGHPVFHLVFGRAAVSRLLSRLRANQPARHGHHGVGLRRFGSARPRLPRRSFAVLPLAVSSGGRDEPVLAIRGGPRATGRRVVFGVPSVRQGLPDGHTGRSTSGGQGRALHLVPAVCGSLHAGGAGRPCAGGLRR